jgi:hypothetical protein
MKFVATNLEIAYVAAALSNQLKLLCEKSFTEPQQLVKHKNDLERNIILLERAWSAIGGKLTPNITDMFLNRVAEAENAVRMIEEIMS